MIWHTHHWKIELVRTADRLRERMKQKRYPEASIANVEKEMLLAFYIIRKLLDAHQVSDKVRQKPTRLRSFRAKGKSVTYLNLHRVDELYDFGQGKGDRLGLRELCNQFVHRYIFVPVFTNRGQIDAVLFSSERTRNSRVYYLKVRDIVHLFEQIGREEITEVVASFDAKKRDFDLKLA